MEPAGDAVHEQELYEKFASYSVEGLVRVMEGLAHGEIFSGIFFFGWWVLCLVQCLHQGGKCICGCDGVCYGWC